MNENDPVDPVDDVEEAGKGLLAGGAAALGGAAAMAKGAVDKAKDAAAGAKDAATDAAGGVAGAASGATGAVTGAAGGVKDAATGAASGLADTASGVTGSAADAVGGAKDAASGAVSGATGAVTGAAGGVVASGAAASAAVTGAAGDAAAGAQNVATGAVDGVVASGSAASASVSGSVPQDRGAAVVPPGDAASAAVVGGGAGAGVGGTGGSGGSGGGGGDDDDDKLVAAAPISGDNQIIILGLLVFLFLFFGGAIWTFFGGGDSEVVLGDVADAEILAETNPECAAVLGALANSDLDEASYEDVTCSSEEGEVFLSGEVESTAVQSAVIGVAGAALLDGDELSVDTEDVTAPEIEEEEEVVEEEPETETAAVETTTTTTEAPETTTTTTEAPETTTTTEAAVAEPVTMWDALNGSGEAVQFAVIGGALGLQDDLEALENPDGTPVNRTLFAPSDAALQALGPEAIAALSADPNAAAALVGYHFLEEPFLAEDLVALDGESVPTRAQLPLNITVVDGQVVLNGVSVVTSADFVADNGVVHIIDTVLDPPTLNEVLELENIEFDQSQATITPAGQATLGRAVEFFSANPTVNASIEGHTDTDGSDELNAELSQARADAVRQFLIDAGLDGERFTATGFGETQPILVDGVEDKAASRRIEFVVQ